MIAGYPGRRAHAVHRRFLASLRAFRAEAQVKLGAWVAPDTFLADGSGVPVFWSHDNLRWIASFIHDVPVEAEPNYVQLEAIPWSDWLERADQPPVEAWPVVAGDSCTGDPGSSSCIAYGGPGVGDWAVRATVWYNGGPAGGGGGVPARQLVLMRVVDAEIQSLSWQQATGTGPGDLGAGDLQGDRFFPDAAQPGGNFRLKVDVLIDVAPNNVPLEVHLLNYDVDDPSDDDGPIDDDPDVAGDNGVDNNGLTEFLDELSVVVTDQGTVAFFTSVQPGDNFRVAGAGRSTELGPVFALAPDAESRLFLNTVQQQGQPVVLDPGEAIIDELHPAGGVHTTPRLTVWRRLHVEVDSMAPVTGNDVTGTIGFVAPQNNGDGTRTVRIDIPPPAPPLQDSINRFENGKLKQGNSIWDVVTSQTGQQFEITIVPLSGNVVPVIGPFDYLRDDDIYKENDDIPTPLYDELGPAMAEAFIEVFVTEDNPNVPFNLNVESTEFNSTLDWDTALNNSNSWWVAYVLGGHQGPTGPSGTSLGDNDPETEAPAVLGATGNPTGGSIIYLETIEDRAPDLGRFSFALERENVVHEVGHAVADSDLEPVTISASPRYTEAFLVEIRQSIKPRCCPPPQ